MSRLLGLTPACAADTAQQDARFVLSVGEVLRQDLGHRFASGFYLRVRQAVEGASAVTECGDDACAAEHGQMLREFCLGDFRVPEKIAKGHLAAAEEMENLEPHRMAQRAADFRLETEDASVGVLNCRHVTKHCNIVSMKVKTQIQRNGERETVHTSVKLLCANVSNC
jgi:hypothetical protein